MHTDLWRCDGFFLLVCVWEKCSVCDGCETDLTFQLPIFDHKGKNTFVCIMALCLLYKSGVPIGKPWPVQEYWKANTCVCKQVKYPISVLDSYA
jgi:hypothetical protein